MSICPHELDADRDSAGFIAPPDIADGGIWPISPAWTFELDASAPERGKTTSGSLINIETLRFSRAK